MIPIDVILGCLVGGLILGGFAFFFILCKIGEYLMKKDELRQQQRDIQPVENLAIDMTE